jgi:hypothetical protein
MPPRDRLVHGTIVRHGCERQKVARMSLEEAAATSISHFKLSVAEGYVMSSSLSSSKLTVNVGWVRILSSPNASS